MEKSIKKLPANAHRWIGEMQEIASTFEDFGVTSDFHKGAEKIYTLLNESQFGYNAFGLREKYHSGLIDNLKKSIFHV